MMLWFLTLAGLGIYHIADDLSVFSSINPYYGLHFFIDHPGVSLAVLGSVCLAVTGAEALYADMGHFGRGPIRGAWIWLVFPALWLNYLGQGALILSDPTAIDNPFYKLAPQGFILPLVILATIATIIASQAVITGAFSLTRQAIQLGLLPRLEIRHTSEQTSGQIYIPRINVMLLIVVLLLVWTFRTSSNLSHAYGISVFGAMMVDSLLAFIVIWKGWRWSLAATVARDDAVPHHRCRLLLGEHAEAVQRRLCAGAAGDRAGRADVDLGARHEDPVRQDAQDRRAAARTRRHAVQEPALPGQGHGGVPDQRSRDRAGLAAAQPQAQQGAA